MSPFLDNNRGQAAFLIWRQVLNGQTVVVWSCIERRSLRRDGPERLTEEEKVELVRGMLLFGPELPQYEYANGHYHLRSEGWSNQTYVTGAVAMGEH